MGRLSKIKRELIQEANRRLIESKLLTEEMACQYSYSTGECGPSYCSSQSVGGGERCMCNSWNPGTDDCDTSDVNNVDGSPNLTMLSNWAMWDALDDGDEYGINPSTDYGKYTRPRLQEDRGIINEEPQKWCTCKHYRCERHVVDGIEGNSSLSWGGCTGSGSCGCMSGWNATKSSSRR